MTGSHEKLGLIEAHTLYNIGYIGVAEPEASGVGGFAC